MSGTRCPDWCTGGGKLWEGSVEICEDASLLYSISNFRPGPINSWILSATSLKISTCDEGGGSLRVLFPARFITHHCPGIRCCRIIFRKENCVMMLRSALGLRQFSGLTSKASILSWRRFYSYHSHNHLHLIKHWHRAFNGNQIDRKGNWTM